MLYVEKLNNALHLTGGKESVFWHPRVDIYQQVLYLSVSTTKCKQTDSISTTCFDLIKSVESVCFHLVVETDKYRTC
jgi:hypothetical protein